MPLPSTKGDWPGPEYAIRPKFRAPLPFVYTWCTDYSSEDPKIWGDSDVSRRRVISRSARRIVFEDLDESPAGTAWTRVYVRLKPPRHWEALYVGNYRHALAKYALSELPDGRTQLEIRWRRKPSFLEGPVVSKKERERDSLAGWTRFARQLEHDYRKAVS